LGFDHTGYKEKDEQKKVIIGEAGFFSLFFPRFPFFPLCGIIWWEGKQWASARTVSQGEKDSLGYFEGDPEGVSKK